MHNIGTCCGARTKNPKNGHSQVCTVPKNEPHAEHENWNKWGVWSKDKTAGGSSPASEAELDYMWPNPDYKPPKNAPIDYSQWVDEFDCLPDA